MSRKYCAECGELHTSKYLLFCTDCLKEMETFQAQRKQEMEADFASFMDLPEDERWRVVFESMWSSGDVP